MEPESKPYVPGRFIALGVVIGAFIGLLLGKFAIGLLVGAFLGIVADATRRRAYEASGGQRPDEGTHS